MVYNSLWDKILEYDPKFIPINSLIEYNGCLDDLLTQVQDILPLRKSNSMSREQLYALAFSSSRIIRAVINNKIENPSLEADCLLREALNLGLEIYKGEFEDLIPNFRSRIIAFGQENILNFPVKQKVDGTSWYATDPRRSMKTAGKLIGKFYWDSILFIALAHGGVAAGMDVFLRYCDIARNNSLFYVVRFSKHKSRDLIPQLSAGEREYLIDSAKERKIVFFDEDESSGETFTGTISYFRDLFSSSDFCFKFNIEE